MNLHLQEAWWRHSQLRSRCCGPCAEPSSPSQTWFLIKCIPVGRKLNRRIKTKINRKNLRHCRPFFITIFQILPNLRSACVYIQTYLDYTKNLADSLNNLYFVPKPSVTPPIFIAQEESQWAATMAWLWLFSLWSVGINCFGCMLA